MVDVSLCKWQYVVAKHLRELCQNTGTTTFDEIKDRLQNIVSETDSLSSMPLNVLSNTLKELRDIGFIRLCGDEYILLDFQSDLKLLPRCTSKGEREIKRYLKSMHIRYEREKSLPGMSYINPLRFDFYFTLGNQKCAIEFDGIQHSHPYERMGGAAGLMATKRRDRVKDEYCKNNDIRLLRVPYTRYRHIRRDVRKFITGIRNDNAHGFHRIQMNL